MTERKIIHIDMDAFYASVEQRDNPALRGRPIAVGHDGPRGVVATASYEARPFGVHSAISVAQALRLCPGIIIVNPRFEVYKEVSAQIHEIFHEYTDLVEPLSLDEAFLDVSHHPSATIVAAEIRWKIWEQTRLTSSAGVSVNKMLAKIASDYRKPNGLFVVEPAQVEEFVASLPIEKFFGIGKVTADKMHRHGIHTGADLRRASIFSLTRWFGKVGIDYYNYARGIDRRPVRPFRERKSIGTENTFESDLSDFDDLRRELTVVGEETWRRSERKEFHGRTVVLKLKFDDFRQITRSHTLSQPIASLDELMEIGDHLLAECDLKGHGVRLLGLTITNPPDPTPEGLQLTLPFPEL